MSDQPKRLTPEELESSGFAAMSEQAVAELKRAWSKDPPTKLPPFGNLVMRLIATVEQARKAYQVAEKKWDEARAEVERLKAELATESSQWDEQHARQHAINVRLEKERDEARAQAARLRGALEFYADASGYRPGPNSQELAFGDVEIDEGARAREALKAEEGK